jgi:hypothetical protein
LIGLNPSVILSVPEFGEVHAIRQRVELPSRIDGYPSLIVKVHAGDIAQNYLLFLLNQGYIDSRQTPPELDILDNDSGRANLSSSGELDVEDHGVWLVALQCVLEVGSHGSHEAGHDIAPMRH